MSRHSSTAAVSVASAAATPLVGLGADLDRLLDSYLTTYDRLRSSIAAHRDAIRAADVSRVREIVAENGQIVAHIAELDQERRTLIARAMRDGLVPPGRDAKLTDVASALPEPQSSRLVRLAIDLREMVAGVQKDQSSLRLAAGALASHMQGLIQHVARRLSHAGTYTRRGVVEGAVLTSALDVRL